MGMAAEAKPRSRGAQAAALCRLHPRAGRAAPIWNRNSYKNGFAPRSGSLLHTAWPSLRKTLCDARKRNAPSSDNLVEFPSASPVEDSADAFSTMWQPQPIQQLPIRATRHVSVDFHPIGRRGRSRLTSHGPLRRMTLLPHWRGRSTASAWFASSRILGTTVHALFERAARFLATGPFRGRSSCDAAGVSYSGQRAHS